MTQNLVLNIQYQDRVAGDIYVPSFYIGKTNIVNAGPPRGGACIIFFSPPLSTLQHVYPDCASGIAGPVSLGFVRTVFAVVFAVGHYLVNCCVGRKTQITTEVFGPNPNFQQSLVATSS